MYHLPPQTDRPPRRTALKSPFQVQLPRQLRSNPTLVAVVVVVVIVVVLESALVKVELHHDSVNAQSVTRLAAHARHHPGPLGLEHVLHLHRLHHGKGLTVLDSIPLLHRQRHNLSYIKGAGGGGRGSDDERCLQ